MAITRQFIPFPNLGRRVIFNALCLDSDPLPSVSLKTLASSDIVAASILEQLCKSLREHGYQIDHAETGHGPYASCKYETPELRFSILLAREAQSSEANRCRCEMQLFVFKKALGKTLALKRPTVAFSQDDLDHWAGFHSIVEKALVKDLRADQVTWQPLKHEGQESLIRF